MFDYRRVIQFSQMFGGFSPASNKKCGLPYGLPSQVSPPCWLCRSFWPCPFYRLGYDTHWYALICDRSGREWNEAPVRHEKGLAGGFILFIVHPVSCFRLGLKPQTRIQIIYTLLVIVLNTFISQDFICTCMYIALFAVYDCMCIYIL